jgi:hypothetical protein
MTDFTTVKSRNTFPKHENNMHQEKVRVCRYYLNGKCTRRTSNDKNGHFCIYNDIKNYHFTEEQKNANNNVKACQGYCYAPFECKSGLNPWDCVNTGCNCENTKLGNCNANGQKCPFRHDADFRLKNHFNKNKMKLNTEPQKVNTTLDDFPLLNPSHVTNTRENNSVSWVNISRINDNSDTVFKMEIKTTQEKPNKEPAKEDELNVQSELNTYIKSSKKRKLKKFTEMSDEEYQKCMEHYDPSQLDFLDQESLSTFTETNMDLSQFNNLVDEYDSYIVREKLAEINDVVSLYQQKMKSNKKTNVHKVELELLRKKYHDLSKDLSLHITTLI